MSKKCNIRSFRYSDEVAAILVKFGSPESSLNDKFEQLVLDCYWKLPELEKQIKARQKMLDELRKECADVQRKIFDQRALGWELDGMMSAIRQCKMRLSDINGKLEKDLERERENEMY